MKKIMILLMIFVTLLCTGCKTDKIEESEVKFEEFEYTPNEYSVRYNVQIVEKFYDWNSFVVKQQESLKKVKKLTYKLVNEIKQEDRMTDDGDESYRYNYIWEVNYDYIVENDKKYSIFSERIDQIITNDKVLKIEKSIEHFYLKEKREYSNCKKIFLKQESNVFDNQGLHTELKEDNDKYYIDLTPENLSNFNVYDSIDCFNFELTAFFHNAYASKMGKIEFGKDSNGNIILQYCGTKANKEKICFLRWVFNKENVLIFHSRQVVYDDKVDIYDEDIKIGVANIKYPDFTGYEKYTPPF